MRRKWGRFRGYMDEIEEDMRLAGERLAEADLLAAEAFEKTTWRGRSLRATDGELLRRALSVPFIGELIRLAWRLGPDAVPDEAPDFEGAPWTDGKRTHARPKDPGFRVDEGAAPVGEELEPPPARLRAAERALASRTRSLSLAVEALVSPRNASAIIRTADALGLQEVHVIQAEGQHRIERTLTMRAERWIDLVWYRDTESFLDAMHQEGRRILVSDFGPGAVSVEDVAIDDHMVLVFGNEQLGVSEEMAAAADAHVFVPTVGFTSYLNVSVAAGIAGYSLDRRMREAGLRRPLEAHDLSRLRPDWYAALARGDRRRAAGYRRYLDSPPDPSSAAHGKHQRTPLDEFDQKR